VTDGFFLAFYPIIRRLSHLFSAVISAHYICAINKNEMTYEKDDFTIRIGFYFREYIGSNG